jgi:lipocalin-like protein
MGGYIMKTAILGSALLFAISLSAPAAEKDLYGTWKMVSQSQKVVDTGEVRAGRGAAPNGYVTFTPDGRVMGIILSDKRPRPESVAKLTDQQRIELFNTMNAYAGTYKLEGNKLTYNYDGMGKGTGANKEVRFLESNKKAGNAGFFFLISSLDTRPSSLVAASDR